jgi:hypothetical protein
MKDHPAPVGLLDVNNPTWGVQAREAAIACIDARTNKPYTGEAGGVLIASTRATLNLLLLLRLVLPPVPVRLYEHSP